MLTYMKNSDCCCCDLSGRFFRKQLMSMKSFLTVKTKQKI